MEALMIAGTAMQAIGTLSNGQQAAAIGARNADVLLQQANETDRATVGRESLLREHFRGGQSFYVCPRVSDLDEIAAFLRQAVPEVKFRIAHGRMAPTELEDIMTGFYDRQFDVLLSTTIVESYADAGGAKGTMLSTTGTSADVYPVIYLGANAYGIIALKGQYAVTPMVVNPKPSDSDPLAQRGSVSWKAMQTAVINHQSYAH